MGAPQGRTPVDKPNLTAPAMIETSDCGASAANGPSRRAVLTAGAALAGVAAELPGRARAQGAADAALDRVQRARRILLKGGVVLTLDRQVGDFTQADVLIEDGMIREVRPGIAVSPDSAAVI